MDGLRHSGRQRNWTAEERFGLVCKVLSGLSLPSVAAEARANPGQPFQWVEACREKGMIGLDMESGRKRKKPGPGPAPKGPGSPFRKRKSSPFSARGTASSKSRTHA